MIKLEELTYVTVIKVEYPNPEGSGIRTLRASVNLLPHDIVAMVQDDADAGLIRLKKVRDCSLAELAQFAEEFEGSIPEIYETILLSDVADADNGVVTFGLISDGFKALPSAAELFDGAAIVFPDDTPAVMGLVEAQVQEGAKIGDDSAEIEITILNSEDDAPSNGTMEPFVPEVAEDNRLAGVVLEDDTDYLAACDILFMETAFVDAKNHAMSSLRREVAGFMIGPPPEQQPNGRFTVHVTQMIPAEHTIMQGASVTYTHDSWRAIHDWLIKNYPNEEQIILGWYHTHPGFGIFLSNMDLFIHKNFFSQPWHVALVLDPVNKRSGYFCWDRSQTQIMPFKMQWPFWAHSGW